MVDPDILLVGNFPPDRQESMLRYAAMLETELRHRGLAVETISPRPVLARPEGGGKWLGYVDKYILFPVLLRRHLRQMHRRSGAKPVLVHICDHSNAVYARCAAGSPVVVTCHDLLAVRGARGEDTGCPASVFGRRLQEAVLRGLRRARFVICVSEATRKDLLRLGGAPLASRSAVAWSGLNQPLEPLPAEETVRRLQALDRDLQPGGYLLHVGSGQPRKNRETVLRVAGALRKARNLRVVFAGEPLSARERGMASGAGLAVVEASEVSSPLLQALYCGAHALLFPSRCEGFGWPVLEALACGCPVVCSNATSLPELAAGAALLRDSEDSAGMAADLERLYHPGLREEMIRRGRQRASELNTARMIDRYLSIYREIVTA